VWGDNRPISYKMRQVLAIVPPVMFIYNGNRFVIQKIYKTWYKRIPKHEIHTTIQTNIL